MKVNFVLPELVYTGGIRVVSIYVSYLAKRGHEVTVVSIPKELPTIREQLSSLRHQRRLIRWQRRKSSHFDELEADIDLRVLMRKRPVRDSDLPDADVVVATWWETAEAVAKLSRKKGVKVYFVQGHEIFSYEHRHRAAGTYRLPMHKITISSWLANIMRETYGDNDLSLVTNGVDQEVFFAPPRGKQSRMTVGLLYSDASIKGVDISTEAYSLASKQIPEIKIVAFGKSPVSPHVPLPKDAQYFVQPNGSKIREIYSGCDAWLFGSREEGFGLPILEAMACRTPVIATPAGAAPELLAGGGGVLVNHEDPQGMAQAIVNIARMPENEWKKMSHAAKETADRNSWETAGKKFEEALEYAIEKRKRRELA